MAAFGQTMPSFDAASIKPALPVGAGPGHSGYVGMKTEPGRTSLLAVPLKFTIRTAYGFDTNARIDGGPDWLDTEMYDVIGTYPADTPKEQTLLMLQSLLADRCKLAVHRETREQPVFALAVAPGGPKLKPHDAANRGNGNRGGRGHLELHNITLAQLGNFFYGELGRFVVDETGLTGTWDIALDWAPAGTPVDDPIADRPSLAKALQEQLGLKLESKKGPVEFLVIDHVEKPTAN